MHDVLLRGCKGFSPGLCTPASPSLWQTLAASHIPVCLYLVRSPHTAPHLLTRLCWAGAGSVRAPTASKQPSVLLECSLYKRPPTASSSPPHPSNGSYFQSISSLLLFAPSLPDSHCVSIRPILALQTTQEPGNTGIEMTRLFFIEMQSSLWWVLVLYFIAISPRFATICSYKHRVQR